jgi:hypothetical protein
MKYLGGRVAGTARRGRSRAMLIQLCRADSAILSPCIIIIMRESPRRYQPSTCTRYTICKSIPHNNTAFGTRLVLETIVSCQTDTALTNTGVSTTQTKATSIIKYESTKQEPRHQLCTIRHLQARTWKET